LRSDRRHHGEEANPNLPEQPDQIVEQAGVRAWRVGAAMFHVHTRNPDCSNTMTRATTYAGTQACLPVVPKIYLEASLDASSLPKISL
jgi:uncharacterized protein (DUF849 family)